MKSYILILALFVFQVLCGQTNTLNFEVIHDGKPLGTLDAAKTTEGQIVIYKSQTKINYHLVVPINIDYSYHVSYNDNELREAKAVIIVNGNEKTNTKTIMTSTGYNFYSGNELRNNVPEPIINHSVIQMLFKEPIGLTKIYSEEHGDFHTLKRINEHTYEKTTSKGRKSTYYYENGELKKTVTDAGVIKFSIIRKRP